MTFSALFYTNYFYENRGAAIAQWICLRLQSCRPGFESQVHDLYFFQFILFKLYTCHLNWNVKRTKINKKRPGLAHFKKLFLRKKPFFLITLS